VEWCRLRFIRVNQPTLRAETYNGVVDAVRNGAVGADIGRSMTRPSTFIGGKRNMHQLFQDAMAIVRDLGHPTYFVTMACNPAWPEITRELPRDPRTGVVIGTATDHPDLLARVFHMKLKALINDLTKNEYFGEVIGRVHTIGSQKRGLPHAHLLLIIKPAYRPRNAEDIGRIVSAEIPDPEANPALYDTVTTCMLHGHCSPDRACFQQGSEVCKKKFPKPFGKESHMEDEGYPLYRRRDNGKRTVKMVNGRPCVFDNRHVVPYNPGVSRKYNCHLNVEVTSGINAVKYI
jgi:hypothetical protein